MLTFIADQPVASSPTSQTLSHPSCYHPCRYNSGTSSRSRALTFNWDSRVQEQRQIPRGVTEPDRFLGVRINRSGGLSNLHRRNGRCALLQLKLYDNGSAFEKVGLCRSIAVPTPEIPVLPPLGRHPQPVFPFGILHPPLFQCVS